MGGLFPPSSGFWKVSEGDPMWHSPLSRIILFLPLAFQDSEAGWNKPPKRRFKWILACLTKRAISGINISLILVYVEFMWLPNFMMPGSWITKRHLMFSRRRRPSRNRHCSFFDVATLLFHPTMSKSSRQRVGGIVRARLPSLDFVFTGKFSHSRQTKVRVNDLESIKQTKLKSIR